MSGWFRGLGTLAVTCILLHGSSPTLAATELDGDVLAAEAERIETIARVSRPTLAIFDSGGEGGGSGVVISTDGYALTNFHVVAPTGPAMKCGLSDGTYVDAVLVGLDPGGDVALIKLLGNGEFPAAEFGDSDAVRVGDWAFVVGNPFLLADDFQPTVTYGIISGVHRYQYPAGTLLEYADCLQTDAAINPGNSGGPLFDSAGRLIGINGRGSFEKRGRVNVDVGYAISVNQIKRFLGMLKSGRIVDHATLGATVTTDADGRVVVDDILPNSDAFRRGLRYDDEVLLFGNRDIGSVNMFKNVLGTYPAGWRVPIAFRRDGQEFNQRVRLSSMHRAGELEAMLQQESEPPVPDRPNQGDEPGHPNGKSPPNEKPPQDGKQPPDQRRPNGKQPPGHGRRARRSHAKLELTDAVKPYYEAAPGYANYWFNRLHQQRVLGAYAARTSFTGVDWNWRIEAASAAGGAVRIGLTERNGTAEMPDGQSAAEFGPSLTETTSPPRSGGLLAALHFWQRLLIGGPKSLGEVSYVGTLPWNDDVELCDCIQAIYAGVEAQYYFNSASGDLVGIELLLADDVDSCQIEFSDIRPIDGRALPHRWVVRHGDDVFADVTVSSYEFTTEPADQPK